MKTVIALAILLASLACTPARATVTFCTDLQAEAEEVLVDLGAVLPEYGTQALAALAPSHMSADQRNAALVASASLGQVAWVQQLLDAGALVDWRDPDEEFSLTPLVAAAWCSHGAVVDRLLAAGAATRNCSELPFAGIERITVCPLHAALAGPAFNGGEPEIVSALRRHGADPAQPDGRGHAAAVYLDQVSPERRAALAAALGSKP